MHVARATRTELERAGRIARVLLTVAFLATVAVLRIVTLSIRHDWVPFFFDLRPGGLHIHHVVWGVLLLLVTGYLAVAHNNPRWRNWLAVAYGIGAALTLDEFALLLHLDDVYWELPGQINLVAVVVLGGLLLVIHDTLPVVQMLARGQLSSDTRAADPSPSERTT